MICELCSLNTLLSVMSSFSSLTLYMFYGDTKRVSFLWYETQFLFTLSDAAPRNMYRIQQTEDRLHN